MMLATQWSGKRRAAAAVRAIPYPVTPCPCSSNEGIHIQVGQLRYCVVDRYDRRQFMVPAMSIYLR